MAIQVEVKADVATVLLEGRVIYSLHPEFKAATDPLLARSDIRLIRFDLSRVDFMDSSALGMLLLMKEKVAQVAKGILLFNLSPFVLNLFKMMHFDKLMPVE